MIQKLAHRSRLLGLGMSVLLMGCASPEAEVSPPPQSHSATSAIVQANATAQDLPITAVIEVAGRQVQLEVAQTPQQQATGLMGRTSLGDDRGMLFPFKPSRPVQFWMKNTLIDLDMVFLKAGVVKAIIADVPPCKADPCPVYGTSEVIDQVVELRGGRAGELGLKVNDRLPVQFLKTN